MICVSDAEAALVAKMFPRAKERLQVIPNGVDAEEIRAATPLAMDGHVVLASGRLEKYKQVGRIVDAMCELDRTYVLRITGDGPERRSLEAQTQRLEVSERAGMLGRLNRDDYLRWLRTASVYVTMSKHEAQGIAVLEALSAGTPVVASDIPAHREIASDAGDSVSLVSTEISPAGLATAIRRAATSPAAAGFTPMSWPEVVDQTISLYNRVLGATLSRGLPAANGAA